ncbi:hypothetical protein A3J36_00665 [Candidatus Uhrbacteria bacterium RIFCSPLOWO2_02_FULL_54_37]|uniref:Polymerase nucleotidyl transferase domain-containing protein n=2 Tax=Candidatus Uhriibacteriota TaxID=1752732 RepID=A0A1F7VHG3_9BACT|nr:MAG: hypothetical protein A3B36_00925 [Candidatus Uhrbacteria bacterium RIFCSPLOWO2_01_FULL_55_36]OGL89943.1 MAG: hypothetical protein A3J36_00665 [Candidatus Uhrbacteria bacterium RIFCSPLOWO2_02_FULL_54_37]
MSRKIALEGALLFGSYAYGSPTRHSDVDLVVISSDFERMEFWDRVGWMMQQRDAKSREVAMDVIGYTPQEFSEADRHSAIMAKAKKDGVWLKKPARG